MFEVKLSTSNAAFEDESGAFEVARILRALADKLEDGHRDGIVKDVNGNTVGNFRLNDAELRNFA